MPNSIIFLTGSAKCVRGISLCKTLGEPSVVFPQASFMHSWLLSLKCFATILKMLSNLPSTVRVGYWVANFSLAPVAVYKGSTTLFRIVIEFKTSAGCSTQWIDSTPRWSLLSICSLVGLQLPPRYFCYSALQCLCCCPLSVDFQMYASGLPTPVIWNCTLCLSANLYWFLLICPYPIPPSWFC